MKIADLWTRIGNNIDLILIVLGLITIVVTMAFKSIFMAALLAGILMVVMGLAISLFHG
ncbi:hypothetical protein ACI3E1_07605 [Ligilactobacillus sp. LYQ139]|uniref:hypothetical protein n=1 Tax=Ligilactobacillus sp. LYQ139 TaxID=3378800 RepID=UPI003852098B